LQGKDEAMKAGKPGIPLLSIFLLTALPVLAGGQTITSQAPLANLAPIQGRESYVTRDGMRIYLWEKYRGDLEGGFSRTGKVALLVHGGVRSGRPAFDLQIRDYSLMDFLAENSYDVWAIDIHGYGHSDKTDKDWSDSRSSAADIAAAVAYITKARGVAKVNLLGWSAGTQRVGVFAMQNPDRVAKLILYAPMWKGTAEFLASNKKRIENGGQPLPQYRVSTAESIRSDFVMGDLAQHPQFEQDVVQELVKEVLQTDPRSPNNFVEWVNLPILDPARITVPTMIIHGERDFLAKEEDLLPFFSQLKTHDKRYVLLPDGGHSLMVEKDHRRFQHEVLSFFDRPQ
jgi:pimeloyl-ACP methyl ester carboxylesterase